MNASDPEWSKHLARVAFVALITLAMLGPWMTVNNTGAGNTARQAGYSIILVLGLIAIRPQRHPERLLAVPWPILMALAWCWISTIWMIDLSVGIRRLVLTTGIIWSLFVLVRHLGPEEIVKILRIILASTLAINFLVVALYPNIGLHDFDGYELAGRWRGLMGHKNYAGIPCALAILFFMFDARCVKLFIRILVCAGSAVFLFMSESKTSMGVCAASAGVGLIFHYIAGRFGQRQLAPSFMAWVLLLAIFLIFLSVLTFPSYYLEILSDPTGFTGRTAIWSALIKAYIDHPWLGVGYGSFWDLSSGNPISKYASGWVTEVSEGHNGYLDMLVQIGLIGTLIVLYAILVWPIKRLLYGGNHPARALSAALIVFAIGHNFTESQIFDRDSLVQVFLVIAIALLWTVTAAPVEGHVSAPVRAQKPKAARAPLRL